MYKKLRRANRRLQFENLETRHLLASSIVEFDEVGYFADSTSNQVQRYDISQERWLTPVNLSSAAVGPTVIHVDGDGIYAAFGNAVYRYDSTGGGRTHLINLQFAVSAIHSDGNILFVNFSTDLYARLISVDKTRNTVIDSIEAYINALGGSSIAPAKNRIFGRSLGISPSDITFVDYLDNGKFVRVGDSPYHGAYPDARQTWVYPNGIKVADDSGTTYSTETLGYLNAIGSLTDLDFLGQDIPIGLNRDVVTAYSTASLPTGSKTLSFIASKIFVSSTSVIAFSPNAQSVNRFSTQTVPLTDLKPGTPGDPVNPVGLAYAPDNIELASDGTLLIFSKAYQSIFRWSPATQTVRGRRCGRPYRRPRSLRPAR